MKYCSKCGNELMNEAVICTKCGCMVEKINATAPTEKNNLDSVCLDKETNSSWIPFVFGILALVDAVLFMIQCFSYFWYFDAIGLSACPLLGIITSIKYFKCKNKTYPILGLIFSCIAVVANLIVFIVSYL